MNRLIIPAALLLFAGCNGFEYVGGTYPTPEQEEIASKLWVERVDLDAVVKNIVSPPSGEGNAAEKYLALLNELKREHMNTANMAILPESPLLDVLANGSAMRLCDFRYVKLPAKYADDPMKLISALREFADGLVLRARKHIAAKEFTDAAADAEAVMRLGLHLSKNFTCGTPFFTSLSIIRTGAKLRAEQAKAAGDAANESRAAKTANELAAVRTKVEDKMILLTDTTSYSGLAAQIKAASSDEEEYYRYLAGNALMVLRFRARRMVPAPGETETGFKDVRVKNASFQNAAEDALKKMAEKDSSDNLRAFAKEVLEKITEDKLEESRAEFFGEHIKRSLRGMSGGKMPGTLPLPPDEENK
jgi:hypothetical protein